MEFSRMIFSLFVSRGSVNINVQIFGGQHGGVVFADRSASERNWGKVSFRYEVCLITLKCCDRWSVFFSSAFRVGWTWPFFGEIAVFLLTCLLDTQPGQPTKTPKRKNRGWTFEFFFGSGWEKRWLAKLHPWKLTWHWKITIFNRKYIFKWWIFNCHVSLPGGKILKCFSKLEWDDPRGSLGASWYLCEN